MGIYKLCHNECQLIRITANDEITRFTCFCLFVCLFSLPLYWPVCHDLIKYYNLLLDNLENFSPMKLLTESWWRHRMEAFSASLALWEGNPPVTGGSPHRGQLCGVLCDMNSDMNSYALNVFQIYGVSCVKCSISKTGTTTEAGEEVGLGVLQKHLQTRKSRRS